MLATSLYLILALLLQPWLAVMTTPANTVPTLPTWVPKLSSTARQLYYQSLRSHNPLLFTIAGDSNSHYDRYLGRVARNEFPLEKYPDLKQTVTHFKPSLAHQSMAVRGGLRAADMFDPVFAEHIPGCLAGEGLFACELRTSNASIIFIQLGTGDKFAWREFERNYRAMIDFSKRSRVLPVLVTKADEMESIHGGASEGYINSTIRRLAAEYQLPLVDLWAATRSLPVILNPMLPTRPFTKYGLQDEWGYYFHLNEIGQATHIQITLETLYSITHP